MNIGIVTPMAGRSWTGNRATAERWHRMISGLGHAVEIRESFEGESWDVLVALHARKSFDSIARFRAHDESRPILVVLTGTDVYQDLPADDVSVMRALEIADRLIVLQPRAIDELPEAVRGKACVIYQSLSAPQTGEEPSKDASPDGEAFDVVVIGHLRPVKDPMRTALAARDLPDTSRVRIAHFGAALDEAFAREARAEQSRNPRYRWLGERPREEVLAVLSRADVLVHPSVFEGGANVVSEAIVHGVPVLASRTGGNVGLLGDDYPGYFEVGDTAALTSLLERSEGDASFLDELRRAIRARQPRFTPEAEIEAWRKLLDAIEARHDA